MSVNGRNQIIKLIREGDLIGERSLISEEPSNLQATALNDIEVCFIPKEEIINDLKNDHDFTMNILKRLAVSLKEADNLVVDMAQKTVKQRLAETLLYLEKNFGSPLIILSTFTFQEKTSPVLLVLLRNLLSDGYPPSKGRESFI